MADPTWRRVASSRPLRGWLVVVGLVAVVVAGAVAFRPMVVDAVSGLEAWVGSLGSWGPVAFVGAYTALTTVGAPMWALTVLSGVIFGPALGLALSSVASTTAATVGMLGARYVARGYVARRMRGNRHFVRLNALIETHGSAVVAFTRLVPLFSFSMLNVAFGLTSVPAPSYIFWSWLCMLPMTLIYVFSGGTLRSAIVGGGVPWLPVGVAVVVAVGLVVVGRRMRRTIANDDPPSSDDGV